MTIFTLYLFVGITCFLTGYIPLASTELILAGVGLSVSLKAGISLALVGAMAQTLAKCHIYFLAKKIVPCFKFKSKRKIVKLKLRFKSKDKLTVSIIFISSLVGIPPYYFINILCGLINTGWFQFCLLGFIGMFIRFYCCLAFPQVVMDLFSAFK